MSTTATDLLIIEDNPADARLIKELIIDTNVPFRIKHVKRLKDGLAAIQNTKFDSILLDLLLPDSRGIETFKVVNQLATKTPVVILTGLADESMATEAVQAGAQDYLIKGTFEGKTLLRSIRYANERQQLFNEIKAKTVELENKNKALDEFAHTLAHQVKGILTQSLGYASYAKMYFSELSDGEFLDVLGKIHCTNQKMANIVDELLLLSSTRQGEVPLQEIDMGQIVKEVQRRLMFDVSHFEGTITAVDDWPTIYGHAPWIEEVWVNYISNGLKYGGQPPELELGYTLSDDNIVRFWVKDNGNGIPSEAQKKLFKPHSRLLQRRVRGEGLGLSVVHQIVKKCGGEVGVDSRVGDGSTFWFTLPTKKKEELEASKRLVLQQTSLLARLPDHSINSSEEK